MLPIKFRGLTISGEWVTGFPSIKPDGTVYISNSAGKPFAYEIMPITIGQFIGAKCDEGKEIYMGDILMNNVNLKEWVVYYEDLAWWVKDRKSTFHEKYRLAVYLELLKNRQCKIRVTGNIYQNIEAI